jgi:hypothetical protein
LYGIYKRAYDSSHRLIRELRLDNKNRPIHLKIYKFDETGVLQEELQYMSSEYSAPEELGTLDSGYGKFQDGTRVIYAYDKFNNWTKKSEVDLAETEKLKSITFRTFIYY